VVGPLAIVGAVMTTNVNGSMGESRIMPAREQSQIHVADRKEKYVCIGGKVKTALDDNNIHHDAAQYKKKVKNYSWWFFFSNMLGFFLCKAIRKVKSSDE